MYCQLFCYLLFVYVNYFPSQVTICRVFADKSSNQHVADKSDQTKQSNDNNLVQTRPEQLSNQVANLKNKIADECSKENLLNNAPINHGFEKTEVASVSLDEFNSNDVHVDNNCYVNASNLANKTQSNVADVNSSGPKLLNKFASENENLKYKINTSNTLERLFTKTCDKLEKKILFKIKQKKDIQFNSLFFLAGCLRITA